MTGPSTRGFGTTPLSPLSLRPRPLKPTSSEIHASAAFIQEIFIAAFQQISRSRYENDYRVACFIIALDFIQTALFIVNEAFDWDIDWNR